MSSNVNRLDTGPAYPGQQTLVQVQRGSGRGSLIIGLTLVAIALFAIVTVITPISGHAMAWFAPTALITAGVIGLAQRR